MKKIIALGVAAMVFSTSAQAIGLGGSKSGKKFNYEACGKIVEGKTTLDEAKKMLKGKPVSTGKQGGRHYTSYSFTKGGGVGVGGFGVRLGSGKAVQYTCTLTHNSEGRILTVDMQQIDTGSQGAGI